MKLNFLLCATLAMIGAFTAAARDLKPWRFYKTITLDTSASGADIKGDVQNFPVAVALKATNFDFRQARSDGSDVRFTEMKDGEFLPHSIESWDSAGKSALVWVSVPVVRGNNRSQSILMHFGNAGVSASDANPKPVFDSKDGFAGVWHLDEEGNTTVGGYKDATPAEAHATGVNLAPGSRVDGRTGKGIALKHAQNQWVKVDSEKRKQFDITNKLTFSIWAKANSYGEPGGQGEKILAGLRDDVRQR